MKTNEGILSNKSILLFLMVGSGIGILLFLPYLEFHIFSFNMHITRTNAALLDKWQYHDPPKPLGFQRKESYEFPKTEDETKGFVEQGDLNPTEVEPTTAFKLLETTETTPTIKITTTTTTKSTAPTKSLISAKTTTVTKGKTSKTTTNTTAMATTSVSTKTILFYTPFFLEKPWGYFMPIDDYTKTCGCNFDHCKISYNINDYSKADIVFFHARDMPTMSILEDLKKKSKKGQYWMYFVKENPFNSPPTGPLNRLFELAMTYRYNSDFPFPYGRYVTRTPEDKEDYTLDVAKNKTKQIAWMVSHCGTRRDKLAKYFEQHGLIIAVGGGCASQFQNRLHCSTKECTEEMSKYKFYFSAENNLCNQYITEKYWSNPFKINAVPIVLGGSNYADPQLAIPGSFINALDFKTPQDLVEYIKKVDSNDTLYNSYFNWKKRYKLFQEKQWGCSYAMCNLCDHLKKGIKVPKDILDNTIYSGSECGPTERFFDQWIQSSR